MEDIPEIKDGVSLITHFHRDHWDKSLFEQMDLHIIAPPKLMESLGTEKKTRFADKMVFKDLSVEATATPHRFAPEHFSYLVTWHGLRLYFPGDTETPEFMLPLKDIDIMFISPWLIRTIERQDLSLDAKILVVYHQKIGEEIPPFQGYKRLAGGDTFVVPYED